ncbi:MAG: GAF domain-containing sensor histidine kinase [Deltaproteobacteria bacterium]|nr:GAF domain-containing sensor histidine kinase [Deltaproteobacteria bacterium]
MSRGLRSADASPDQPTAVAELEASDLQAINHWLCETRWRTGLTVAIAMPAIGYLGGVAMRWLPVTLVCVATACLSPVYRRMMARGADLRAVVYTQLILDTIAIAAGLLLLGPTGVLFGYFFLMTIVPATMVSALCGVVITSSAALGYGLVVALGSPAAIREVHVGTLVVVAVFVFAVVASQCYFYKRNLRDKNRCLAATGERLAATNVELTVAAETALGLFQVTRALGTSLDLGIVIDRLHAVAAERLKTDWCATILTDPSSPSGYCLMASRGLGGSPIINTAFWDFGAVVLAEGVVEMPNAAEGSGARAVREWNVASGIFTGMRCGNRTVGIFATGSRSTPGAFSPLQRELVAGIATQAAFAIENATLHARQREEAEISAALLRVSELLNANPDADDRLERLTGLTCDLVGCEFINIVLCDPKLQTCRVTAGTDRVAPSMLLEVKQIDFELRDFPELTRADHHGWSEIAGTDTEVSWMQRWSLRSWAAVPLRLRGEIIGYLTAGSHTQSGAFHPKARRLLAGIAQQTVTAIENGRLLANLRAANNLKSEFIGTMSHELRTPLNAIIGYNELLSDGEFGPVGPEQREVCCKVLQYSRQLLELIQATLDVSRMESGALPVTLEPVDVRRLLAEVEAEIPAAWVKPGVVVSIEPPVGVPIVQSDHPKLKMVVRNLVHNALKFTDAGSVTVRSAVDAGHDALLIAVADTGIGISPEGQGIIFDMFRQVDGSDRRRHDGVGLGLYIVRRLTALLGGTIGVESEVGKGSRFEIRLPLRPCGTSSAGAPPLEKLSA